MKLSELKRRVKILHALGYERRLECGVKLYEKRWHMEDYHFMRRLDNSEILKTDYEVFKRILHRNHADAINHLQVMIITGGHGI
jgi:hypothetical protein